VAVPWVGAGLGHAVLVRWEPVIRPGVGV